jgi:hypothetical protein
VTPVASQRPGSITRDGSPTREVASPFSDPPPGRPSFPDGGFLPEARTMEVSVRSTDIGGPPTAVSVVDRAVLLRMDGVQAGQIIGLDQWPFTLGATRPPVARRRRQHQPFSCAQSCGTATSTRSKIRARATAYS